MNPTTAKRINKLEKGTKMKDFYKKIIFLDKHKAIIVVVMFLFSFISGFFIYHFIYGLSILQALSATVNIYIDTIAIPIGDRNDIIWGLEITSIVAKFTLFFAVIILFLKSQLVSVYHFFSVRKGGHILVIGLDSNSRFFIDSEIKRGNENIVVIENDEFNPYIDIYRDRAISVLHKEIDSVISDIGIDTARYIFVSTGDSQENISIALKIIKKAKPNPNKKLLIHIEDRTLRSLYNDESLLGSNKLNVQPFSYHKESATMLFQSHDIDGEGDEIINSNESFEIAVVGNSNLAIEVIVEAIKMSHLPNESQLIINCIDSNPRAFKQRVKYEMPYIKAVKHIKLNFIELDYQSMKFYYHKLWSRKNLKHIILCYKKSIININVSTKLKKFSYKSVIDNTIRKIHIATYDNIELSKELRRYSREKDDMFIFATANWVCSSENLMKREMEKIAKMIHYSYNLGTYDRDAIVKSKKIIERVWEDNVSINDKRASLAQAKHIKVKLKSLGINKIKSTKSISKLLEINQTLMDKILKDDRKSLNLEDKNLEILSQEFRKYHENKKYEVYYFPKKYNILFEKLLRAEHNRWIAMLAMMDNHYDKSAKGMDKKERKIKKIHYLMKPFEEFEEDEKIMIINDIFSILYIPVYLACLGYEMREKQ